MTSAQKTIKYLAIAFAIFLIVTIFSAIANLGVSILKNIGLSSNTTTSDINTNNYNSYIDINIKYASIKLIKSDSLKVDNNNDKINVKIDTNKLSITDSSNIFSKNDKDIIVYIPNNIKFDIVNINTGAGKVNIEGFNTKELSMSIGAGKSVIENIYSDKTKIDTGAGSVEIKNCQLNDAKFDLGIGTITIDGNLTGNSKINSGIGKTSLKLTGTINDYSFDVDKGIGNINLNNEDIKDGTKIGNGKNRIEIDGGIGEIVVNTK